MDEKGFSMGIADKSKIICRCGDYNRYRLQPGNREWVTLIESVSVDRFVLPAYIIFQGQQIQASCGKAFSESHASIWVSPKGWTDNEIGIQWLEDIFDKHTALKQISSYKCK